jgi:hypothetical protein
MSLDFLDKAHRRSIFHRAEILAGERCGCFDCLAIFAPDEITDWTDTGRPEGEWTALCPSCGMDAVIGDRSGLPITKDFLSQMHARWLEDEDDKDDE